MLHNYAINTFASGCGNNVIHVVKSIVQSCSLMTDKRHVDFWTRQSEVGRFVFHNGPVINYGRGRGTIEWKNHGSETV